ncbi:MAG TPA: hypothetical protein VKE41_22975 [Roseiflexaceae bacterium]|nr:hypothetical protein [Roseiflexaceae bacterium]
MFSIIGGQFVRFLSWPRLATFARGTLFYTLITILLLYIVFPIYWMLISTRGHAAGPRAYLEPTANAGCDRSARVRGDPDL